ncbi:hypothetical protein [Saccharicrinis aurantiacus]|uniref:hypothetical protein n=1 Tax=Saccharicrinis aurantiacus TaxID=1849719 RepID=UPI00249179B1|nr:hypothetical protein [Saccharicrinis aurantiacus]
MTQENRTCLPAKAGQRNFFKIIATLSIIQVNLILLSLTAIIQGCFTNHFLIYLNLKCGQVIFEQSSQLLGLTKALAKTKALCKEAFLRGAYIK